jgi:hypothetical protein
MPIGDTTSHSRRLGDRFRGMRVGMPNTNDASVGTRRVDVAEHVSDPTDRARVVINPGVSRR